MSDFLFSNLFKNRFYSIFEQIDSFFGLLTSSSKNIVFFQFSFQNLFEHQNTFSDILNDILSKKSKFSFSRNTVFIENINFFQQSFTITASELLTHKTIEKKRSIANALMQKLKNIIQKKNRNMMILKKNENVDKQLMK